MLWEQDPPGDGGHNHIPVAWSPRTPENVISIVSMAGEVSFFSAWVASCQLIVDARFGIGTEKLCVLAG